MTDPKIQSLSSQICQPLTSSPKSLKQCQSSAGIHLDDPDRLFCKPADNKTNQKMIKCFQNNMDSWALSYDVPLSDNSVFRIPNRIYWKYFDTVDGQVPRLPDLNKVYNEVVVTFFKDEFIVTSYAKLAEIGFKDSPLTTKVEVAGSEETITAYTPEEKAVIMWKGLQDAIAKNANKKTLEENKIYVEWQEKGEKERTKVLLSKIDSKMSYAEMVQMSKAQFLYIKRAVIGVIAKEEKGARAAGNIAVADDFQKRIGELEKEEYQFPYSEAQLAGRLHARVQEVVDSYYYILQDKMPLKDAEKSDTEKVKLVLSTPGVKYEVDEVKQPLGESYWVTKGKPSSLEEVLSVGNAILGLSRKIAMKHDVKVPPEIGDKPKTLSGGIGAEYSTAGSLTPNFSADLKIAMVGTPDSGFFLQGRITALYLDPNPGTVHPDGPVSTADDVTNPKKSLQIIYAQLMGQYVFENDIRLHGTGGVIEPRSRTTPGIAFDRFHQGNGEGNYQISRITGVNMGVDIPLQKDVKKPISVGVDLSLGASGNPVLYKENTPGDEKPNTFWFDSDMGGGRLVHAGRVRLFKNSHSDYDTWLESMNVALAWEVLKGKGDESTKSKFGIIGEGRFNLIPGKKLLQAGAGFYVDLGDGISDFGVSGVVGLNPWKWLRFNQYVTYGSSSKTYHFGRQDGPNGPFDHSVLVDTKTLSWATQATIGPFKGVPVLDSFEFTLQYMGEQGVEAESGYADPTRKKTVHGFGVGAQATF